MTWALGAREGANISVGITLQGTFLGEDGDVSSEGLEKHSVFRQADDRRESELSTRGGS